MGRRALCLTLLIAGAIVGGGAAAPPEFEPSFASVLTRDLRFSSDELKELSRGRVVSHVLPAGDVRELAVVGAVRVNTPASILPDRVRDITRFKYGDNILQIGRFGDPPAAGDLAPLAITRDDADLRTCRVGDCNVRLSAAAIGRIQREVDWRAADADARAASLFKDILLDDVRAYVSGGPGRMVRYADGDDPIEPIDDFEAVLRNSPLVANLVPALPAHLAEFPFKRFDGVDDFLYWSKEKFGLAPFITVTHVSLARTAAGAQVITTKDVYSSRYVDTSLGTTIASDVPGQARRCYVVYVSRSRAHALAGMFNAIRRAIAERRTRAGLEQSLKTTRLRLERGL